MCMLFMWCNQNPQPDEFSLILTSIRDEYFMRPTEVCSFWDQNPNIIGGMDLEKGREGGTWLAMHKTSGKIGILLNVLQPIENLVLGKKHRGFLVPEFLESQMSGPEFLMSLSESSSEFADFLMVTVDVGNGASAGSTVTSFLTNMESNLHKPEVTKCSARDEAVLAFGNHLPHKPWIKTMVGRKLFQNISQRNIKVKRKRSLIRELFDMINDDTEYFPDERLLSDGRGYDEEYLRALSALRVRMPTVGFGTRTQSIILVDQKGRVEYIEKTIGQDFLLLNDSCNHENWPKRVFNFRISSAIPDTAPVSRPSFLLPIYSLPSRL